MVRSVSFGLVALIAALLIGCAGGNKPASTQATTATSPAAATAASPAAAPGASPMSAAVAPVPAKLDCGAVKPVWINTRTRVYHESSDPLYGRTKHGKYMCPAQAAAAGYHAAGGGRHHGHRKRGGGAMAQPSPSPSM